MGGTAAFVGRDRELSRLRSDVGGDTRLLLVLGDAGVGKTRLVAEGMQRMAGVVSVWGGCLPMRETLPLLPVMDALAEPSRVDGGKLLDAALAVTPRYVRVEVERLLPQLGSGAAEASGPGDGGQRERLFAAIAELLGAAARRRDIALVVEDVHWADTATLDCVTFLTRPRRDAAATVVVTCRSDETLLEPEVAEWLTHVRGRGGVAEVRLGPLSRDEVAEQVAELSGSPASAPVVDELYTRAEGNPFFTEQLVAAMVGSPDGVLGLGAALPTRLAELLLARAAGCSETAGTVLSALAVAARPLSEDLLEQVSGLEVDVLRGGLRELSTARLLADGVSRGGVRPRHALLAEAVTAELLPGERAALHERLARALQAAGDDTSAAEVAGHWAAAGRAAEELPARLRAAEAAERVFGYLEAARHWQRAIDLFEQVPDPERAVGMDLPHLYVRAIDSLEAAGEGERRSVLAEEAYRRFAHHPDPATAAVIHVRAARLRSIEASAAGLSLIEQALQLFEHAPPSLEQAEAWFTYAYLHLFHVQGRFDASSAALDRALEIAEAADATALIAHIRSFQASHAFFRGQVEQGFAFLELGRAVAEASQDDAALLQLAINESDAMLKMGRFAIAAEAALRGVEIARRTGRQDSFRAFLVAGNAAEALIAQGRTVEAAGVIDPLTYGSPDRDRHVVHDFRLELDLLRGDLGAATVRQRQLSGIGARIASVEYGREMAQRAAELALWAGRPGDALAEVSRVLARIHEPDLTVLCGRLLVAGMRACADLAEQARARRDDPATQRALAAAHELAAWVAQMAGTPFADHPFAVTIPAERAVWDAERTRLAGASDPTAWHAAAKAWDDLGSPHRAAYAWWRGVEARLLAGEPPAAVADTVRAAAAAAAGHAPLLAAIDALADRARIPLATVPADVPPSTVAPTPYGLTERELLVLRLLVAGRSNGEIGAELFISRKTASVHVSNILRKLGVSTRVQAAALAERAGLVRTS